MKRLLWTSLAVFLIGLGVGRHWSRTPQAQEAVTFFAAAPAATVPSQETAEPTEAPELPWTFPYTSLVAEGLIAYDGPYWEDGGGEEVAGIAALILRNTGTVGIAYARLSVNQEGRELNFDATYIPPRSTVLVLEENRQAYGGPEVTQWQCRTVIPGNFDLAGKEILLSDEGLAGLQIGNRTDRVLANIRVYYKLHYGDEGLYMGGITYSTSVENLQPGETRTLQPWRYAHGTSRVVAVVVEELPSGA